MTAGNVINKRKTRTRTDALAVFLPIQKISSQCFSLPVHKCADKVPNDVGKQLVGLTGPQKCRL